MQTNTERLLVGLLLLKINTQLKKKLGQIIDICHCQARGLALEADDTRGMKLKESEPGRSGSDIVSTSAPLPWGPVSQIPPGGSIKWR